MKFKTAAGTLSNSLLASVVLSVFAALPGCDGGGGYSETGAVGTGGTSYACACSAALSDGSQATESVTICAATELTDEDVQDAADACAGELEERGLSGACACSCAADGASC